MPRPSVLVTRRLPSSAVTALQEHFDVDMHTGETGLDPAALHQRLAGKQALVVLLGDRIDRAAIEAGTSLKIIANVAVGYDNLDVAFARSRDIVVTNTPDVLTDAVADFTWALILSITRRLGEGERLVRRGDWRGWAFDFMLGTSLSGKLLGIVGAGRIGRAVGARAAAFGMQVAYHSRREVSWPGAEPMSFDKLLATADIVSLHVPLRPGDAASDRPASARAYEADRVPREHHARSGGGRSRAGLGTEGAADCGRGTRRLRARAGGS